MKPIDEMNKWEARSAARHFGQETGRLERELESWKKAYERDASTPPLLDASDRIVVIKMGESYGIGRMMTNDDYSSFFGERTYHAKPDSDIPAVSLVRVVSEYNSELGSIHRPLAKARDAAYRAARAEQLILKEEGAK